MTLSNPASCGLHAYLEALGKEIQSTNESSATWRGTTDSHSPTSKLTTQDAVDTGKQDDNNLHQLGSVPTLFLPDEGTLRRQTSSKKQRNHERGGISLGANEDHLGLVNEIYEYCSDASSCNYQAEYRPHGSNSRRREKLGIDDEDSSDSDNGGGGGYDDDDYVYDSDLESVSSELGQKSHAKKMRKWKSLPKGRFERMLLDCIVNTDRIASDYRDIYVDPATIMKLEQVTSLSLRRPRAFSHGVLKNNKVTGAVLYGPPGTGKSLLAKGMAKQSEFNMLSISTSEVWQKCHGEDEKMIKAVFSMARKLHPCIVFVDEADAMLGQRKAGEKRHIRSMLNQFLMEWDGLTSGLDAPFVLLATNRPFDLDPAVLRRAPVQIHLDIPTMKERTGILTLLLREEELQGIGVATLASLTKGYTGSDLKNLCVTAATNCVVSQQTDTSDRVLTRAHFFAALSTIRPVNLGRVNANELRKFEGNSQRDIGDSRRDEEDDE